MPYNIAQNIKTAQGDGNQRLASLERLKDSPLSDPKKEYADWRYVIWERDRMRKAPLEGKQELMRIHGFALAQIEALEGKYRERLEKSIVKYIHPEDVREKLRNRIFAGPKCKPS